MNFYEFCLILEDLETTSSRNEMTKKLAALFGKLTPQEAKFVSYFLLGELESPYIGTQFSIAEKTMIVALATYFNVDAEEIKKRVKIEGDVTKIITANGWHKEKATKSIEYIYDDLVKLENISGIGSQEEKINTLIKIFGHVTALEAKYIVRIILGKLRLGFSDMTLLDALSWFLVGDKSEKKVLEEAYNMCVDIGLITATVLEKGIEGIKRIHITLGIPIRPAAAERLKNAEEIFEKLGPCVAQPKIDGFRLQIHLDKEKNILRFFSRHLVDMSQMFPDLIAGIKQLDCTSIICEGEAIGYNKEADEFLHFQETVKRKRKHGIEEAQEEHPLKLFLFDLLYCDGKSYLNEGHEARRKKLEKICNHLKKEATVQCIEEYKINSADQLEDVFLLQIEHGLEGLVVKRSDAVYQAGKRNFNWIKLKRTHEDSTLSDSIDVVIIGYYFGRGKRARFGIGALLAAVYNEKKDMFETIAKIGTGLKDEEFIETKKKLDVFKMDEKPHNVVCDASLTPDVWIEPKIVCEIYADEVTSSPIHAAGKTANENGYALRFPRFLKYRDDKSATESTTVKEIEEMYQDQKK